MFLIITPSFDVLIQRCTVCTPARRSRSVHPKDGRRKHNIVFIIGTGQRNCSERNLPSHVVTKGYRIPARDVISIFVLARMLAGSSDEEKKKNKIKKIAMPSQHANPAPVTR